MRRGFDHATGIDRILLGQRIEDRLWRDAERRELGVRELDIDLLVLHAVQVHLGNVGDFQQPLPHAFGDGLELGVIGAVAGHHVEDGIDVAVFIIDVRTNQAARQIALDVDQFLAQQIEQVRHILGRSVVLECHLHRGERRLGVGRHLVEVRQFLHLLLNGVGDLGLHFLRSGAGPDRSDDSELDGEGRIFRAPERAVGEKAGHAQRNDEEQDERGMGDGPGGQIEALHDPLPAQNDSDATTRTFWAGSSFCTPSATTRAPSSTPPVMTASLVP